MRQGFTTEEQSTIRQALELAESHYCSVASQYGVNSGHRERYNELAGECTRLLMDFDERFPESEPDSERVGIPAVVEWLRGEVEDLRRQMAEIQDTTPRPSRESE